VKSKTGKVTAVVLGGHRTLLFAGGFHEDEGRLIKGGRRWRLFHTAPLTLSMEQKPDDVAGCASVMKAERGGWLETRDEWCWWSPAAGDRGRLPANTKRRRTAGC
jgi:hypothetical protein